MKGKIFLIFSIVSLVGFIFISNINNGDNGAEQITRIDPNDVRMDAVVDILTINKNDIDEIAKFYPVIVDGNEMEVIAVRASDGTIRTSFNACQVCADSGRGYYVQEGEMLVCQNCGVAFNIDQLELIRGGCNPAPIIQSEKEETEDIILIPKDTFKKYQWLYGY